MSVADISNYVQWNAQLSSAGQPTKQQLANLSGEGFTVVINLAMPDERHAPIREDFIVTNQAIEFIHIPVVWTKPTYRNLMHFFSIMDLYAGEKILVHCIMNMRATAFIYLYITLRQRVSETESLKLMAEVWLPDKVWQAFIDTSTERYKKDTKHG